MLLIFILNLLSAWSWTTNTWPPPKNSGQNFSLTPTINLAIAGYATAYYWDMYGAQLDAVLGRE